MHPSDGNLVYKKVNQEGRYCKYFCQYVHTRVFTLNMHTDILKAFWLLSSCTIGKPNYYSVTQVTDCITHLSNYKQQTFKARAEVRNMQAILNPMCILQTINQIILNNECVRQKSAADQMKEGTNLFFQKTSPLLTSHAHSTRFPT